MISSIRAMLRSRRTQMVVTMVVMPPVKTEMVHHFSQILVERVRVVPPLMVASPGVAHVDDRVGRHEEHERGLGHDEVVISLQGRAARWRPTKAVRWRRTIARRPRRS